MAGREVIHCVVDDTVLTANIDEIEAWVSLRALTLVVPLYSTCPHHLIGRSLMGAALERLNTLKKDASQIGMNARKAVKFLDRVTSGKDDSSPPPAIIQGPEEQYATWAEVEEHYTDSNESEIQGTTENEHGKSIDRAANPSPTQSAGGALSQMLLSKLNFAKSNEPPSPHSTPPASRASSEPQSSKTSPEVKSASLTVQDTSPTPPALKPLINSVVWYYYEKKSPPGTSMVFLTNAGDTANLMRNFGIVPKNIHQLRTSIGLEDLEIKNQNHNQQRIVTPPPAATSGSEPKPLFRYEDGDSDEEVVVFKPRGRGSRATANNRISVNSHHRNRHSLPKANLHTVESAGAVQSEKPQVPIEEIDPDSFDRGSFARGSVPLVNTSNYPNGPHVPYNRGRGGFFSQGPSRGGQPRAVTSRGVDRGNLRGRGRLFVP